MNNTNLFGIERITQDGKRIRFVFHIQSDAMVRIRQFVGSEDRLSETNYTDIPNFHLSDYDSDGNEYQFTVSMVNSISLMKARKVWDILTTRSDFNRMAYETVVETIMQPK